MLFVGGVVANFPIVVVVVDEMVEARRRPKKQVDAHEHHG